ncbi:MAG: transcriptional regulator, IclR family [Microbacteriaceae bacterium]|nr:transcriptional regulator, IclR family [Microbacteriaceae bacterium]
MQNNTEGATTENTTPYAVESVINAARILLMLRSTRALQVGQVADELGVARSTAHRLLTTLQSQGLLAQAAARRAYTPGPALVEIGASVVGAVSLRELAQPILERVAHDTGETAHLLVLHGTEVVFVDGVEGRHAIRAATRVGERELAHVSAGGKALLAELSEEELDRRYPDEKLSGGTDSAIGTRTQLKSELARIREDGFAVNRSESEAGLCAVSVAIHDAGGSAIGVISISGPSMRLLERVDELAGGLRARVADLNT